ncbi:MAG: helix-turn-helix transcriptional regulator [Thermoleophilaceae bacterium]|nr:helix-turn-helix transcriptional regulator [Thermoleophilaceae bacterium]
MSLMDVALVVGSGAVVLLLALADPKDACYLLAFPIWLVAKDLGAGAGAVAAGISVAIVVALGLTGQIELGALGYAARVAVFSGAVAAGVQARVVQRAAAEGDPLPLLRLITARPEVSRRPEPLSRRELEILEMIATGAKNAEIASRFVISQNTVKTHVGQILRKLPAANRTEAAFRYIELYGAPHPVESQAVSASTAVAATVSSIGGKDLLVMSLTDGRELELPLVDQLRDRVRVGSQAIVYFDQHGREVGWYMPDEELGVDLRHWAH